MKVTPLDIQQQHFKKSFIHGYSAKEVDQFLDLVREEFEKIIIENNAVRDEIKRREAQILEFQSRERVLKDTMITAQKITEDIKDAAKKEGDLVLAQAEIQADKIIRAAQNRLNEIIDDINELKRQRVMFETNLKSIVDKHLKLLEITADEETRSNPIEDKIAFLPK
jgi:cell division initiation protein